MLSSSEIRKQYLEFFEQKYGHTHVPSSSVVPHGDDTLLFTNAGMNQFKDVFLGLGTRPYTRAVDTQKCIRAGGKHNDLDAVGKDTYHHTFFEMLGNWSFGDYFKEEAIRWAWELLTEVWGLEKDRLHATVFEGKPEQGLEPDEEAAGLWRTVTDINPEHIHYCSMKDNFWEMGDSGPCGPCTEIHIDLTPDKSGRGLVNQDDPRVIEIWNLVFIQYNRDVSGELKSLPAKHVDTGMGFERICAAIQGKASTYDSDLFAPLFSAIQDISGAPAYTGSLESPVDTAYRVIADHIRTLCFSIADGARPDKDGRGSVLRRILRRAVRYGRQILGLDEPFFYKLVPTVTEQFGEVFPELRKDPEHIAAVIQEEEELFGETWERGIKLFTEEAEKGQQIIPGPVVFKLESTYGFSHDLTQLMAEDKGLGVDLEGYQVCLKEHQEISKGKMGQLDLARQTLVEIVQQNDIPETEFLGYTELSVEEMAPSHLFRLEEGRYQSVDVLEPGEPGAVVVGKTPCYAESGGQVGDSGSLRCADKTSFEISDTVKVGSVFFHLGQLERGELTIGKSGRLEVDVARRQQITIHHTTTHLLNHKLRAVLGNEVEQKGSLVDEWKTRFDFSHGKPLKSGQIEKIQTMVQADIEGDLPVYDLEVPQDKAFEVNGLRAVFGEKYPPKVRIVSVGHPVEKLLEDPTNETWVDFSAELCGGVHLARTGEAGAFVVVSEEGVGKGVRRVTGIAGGLARQALATAREFDVALEALDALEGEDLSQGISRLREQLQQEVLPLLDKERVQVALNEQQKRVKMHQKQHTKAIAQVARDVAEESDGSLIVTAFEDADQSALRSAMDVIHGIHPEAAMLLGSVVGEKVAFVARVPQGLIKKGLKAGDWVKTAAGVAGGGGGGRPDMAQAGGKDPSKLAEALEVGRQFAREKLQLS